MNKYFILIFLICEIVSAGTVLSQPRIGKKDNHARVINTVAEDFPAERLSPSSKHFIKARMKSSDPGARNTRVKLKNRFPVETLNSSSYIGALVRVNPGIDRESLNALGVITGARAGHIWSMKIPVDQVIALSRLPGIEYVDVDNKIDLKLDSARSLTRVEEVHQGINLPKAYTGNDVVIGIIDTQFDFTHPVFYDSSGNNLRISRVWIQNDDTGTPPQAEELDYGTELVGQDQILEVQFSSDEGSHGTHVAGIAGASGVPTEGIYAGMAGNAELVFVEQAFGRSGIADAIFYILDYAERVNKPVVVNISLGSHVGPHDGTSSLDMSIDSYSDFGVIVGAAGNEGFIPLHLNHVFDEDTVFSFVNFDSDPEDSEDSHHYTGEGLIDIWGAPNSDIVAAVNVYRVSDGSVFAFTDYINSESGNVLDTIFEYNADSLEVSIATEASNPNNNKPDVQIYILNPTPDLICAVELINPEGEIHAWNHGTGTGAPFTDDFAGQGTISSFIPGDTEITVSEIGGTANRIVTAGAYTSKNQYEDYFGQTRDAPFFTETGALAPFSSHGPTVDGRTKPEIAAPGNVVVSSVNSFDEDQTPENSIKVVAGVEADGKEWYFSALQGTSMSSPATAGIIALLLEAYPDLTPEQAKDILSQTALEDSFTGSIPDRGSNTWGWGKINALGAIDVLLGKIPAKPTISAEDDLSFCQGGNVTLTAPEAADHVWSNGDSTRSITVSEEGMYAVKTINSEGYLSPPSDSVQVTVHALPEVEIVLEKDAGSADSDSAYLAVTENETFSYEWFREEEQLEDTTHRVYIELIGTYRVNVTDENGCAGSDTLEVRVLALGGPELTGLKVYPNPTSGMLRLGSGLKGPSAIRVYDMNGRTVFREDIFLRDDFQLELNPVRKGTYIIHIQNGGKVYAGKILIE